VCCDWQTQSKYYKKIIAENEDDDTEESLNYKLLIMNPIPYKFWVKISWDAVALTGVQA
jgi:hypothetical protein